MRFSVPLPAEGLRAQQPAVLPIVDELERHLRAPPG